jgi:homocysteine S-methyltransferase
MARKAEAGAQVVYTQPVFDEKGVDDANALGAKLKLPVLVGVMPLRNARHCEFMHNEVPGITIPESLRKAIVDAPDDESALRIGQDSVLRLSSYVRKCAQGLYIMPPANQHQVAEQIIRAVV